MVTHRTTSPPVRSLSSGERTGSSVLCDLWSYVLERLRGRYIYLPIWRRTLAGLVPFPPVRSGRPERTLVGSPGRRAATTAPLRDPPLTSRVVAAPGGQHRGGVGLWWAVVGCGGRRGEGVGLWWAARRAVVGCGGLRWAVVFGRRAVVGCGGLRWAATEAILGSRSAPPSLRLPSLPPPWPPSRPPAPAAQNFLAVGVRVGRRAASGGEARSVGVERRAASGGEAGGPKSARRPGRRRGGPRRRPGGERTPRLSGQRAGRKRGGDPDGRRGP